MIKAAALRGCIFPLHLVTSCSRNPTGLFSRFVSATRTKWHNGPVLTHVTPSPFFIGHKSTAGFMAYLAASNACCCCIKRCITTQVLHYHPLFIHSVFLITNLGHSHIVNKQYKQVTRQITNKLLTDKGIHELFVRPIV